MSTTSGQFSSRWIDRAGELADWTWQQLVVRKDAWVEYYIDDQVRVAKRTVRGVLTRNRIITHFEARDCTPIVSLFSAVREPGQQYSIARELTIDVDCHDSRGDRNATFKASRAWYKAAVGLGFLPILENSSINSYHLRIIFNQDVAASTLRAFGIWLSRDWRNHGLSSGPEIFPKQDNLAELGSEARCFGSPLRLFGRNPNYEFWSLIYDGEKFLSEDAAIDLILSIQGDDPDRIPEEARKWKQDRQDRIRTPRDQSKRDLNRDIREAKRALAYLDGDLVDDRNTWLRVGFALFDLGDAGLPIWEDWSKGSSKFKDGECAAFWKGFHAADDEDNTTIATLFWYAKKKGYRPESTTRSDEPKSPTQCEMLLDLAAGATLFQDDAHVTYAAINVDGHTEVHVVYSTSFRQWMRRQYREAWGKMPSSEAMQSALDGLDAVASNGPTEKVFLRVGELGNKIYIDMGDRKWQAIEVDADGWRVLPVSPVRFWRPSGMKSFPGPVCGGKLCDLRAFLNISDREFALFIGWLVVCFLPRGPYPILVLIGEQGTGKSTLADVAKRLVDPQKVTRSSPPKTPHDMAIAASNRWVLTYENLSRLSAWLSDMLCTCSTGGGYSTRSLYKNNEEQLFEFQRPVILNGIADFMVEHPDLTDRGVFLHLEPIAPKDRKAEKKFWADFDAVLPALFGAILDAVAGGLKKQSETAGLPCPRMADFGLFAEAAWRSLGHPDNEFLNAYSLNRKDAIAGILEDSPVAVAMVKFMKDWKNWNRQTNWEGSATELLEALNGVVSEKIQKSKRWPRRANTLAGAIRKIAPGLRESGINITHEDRVNNHEPRKIKISFTPAEDDGKRSAPSAPSAPSSKTQGKSGADPGMEIGPVIGPDRVGADLPSRGADPGPILASGDRPRRKCSDTNTSDKKNDDGADGADLCPSSSTDVFEKLRERFEI
jgi:hypothetical protein